MGRKKSSKKEPAQQKGVQVRAEWMRTDGGDELPLSGLVRLAGAFWLLLSYRAYL